MDIEVGEQEGEHVATDQREPHTPNDAPAGGIDIAKLTAKVYRLMLDELRLERARGPVLRDR